VYVTSSPGPVISTSDLTKRFGGHRGVDAVTIDVHPGEVFGFLGPNGAGKSTTIRLLMGLYRPTSGSVRVQGLDPVADGAQIRRTVGYLPGELALFPRLTGRDLLERLSRARGLRNTAYRDGLVHRFGAEIDRPLRTLSKGNRQKIGIVQAFMHRPRLVILDEPTSGLDPLLQEEFARLIESVAADGATVFLSSHDLDEVQRLVTRLAIIRDGRIVTVDTVEGLRHTAPRVIDLRFDGPPPVADFARLPGVTVNGQRAGRQQLRLSVTGPVAPVLGLAAHHGVADITARPADLEELFLRYYSADPKESIDAH
jgi:ABC-2 type transport system ATP-binding protein